MYTTDPNRCRAVQRAGVVVGAVAVLVSDSGDPEVTMRWARATDRGQTPAQFRAMLLGAGTVAAPQGEVGAWLELLNAQADVETQL